MTTLIKHKRVEIFRTFYDLVCFCNFKVTTELTIFWQYFDLEFFFFDFSFATLVLH